MSTLADIRTKVRRVTGRPSTNQITDAEVNAYINDFLIYELPSHTRLFYNRIPYTFQLTPNDATYPITNFKNSYMTFEPPAYIDGFQIQYLQDEQSFYQMYPRLKYSSTFATATGIAGPYAGTFSYTPVDPGTVVISGYTAAGANVLATDVQATATTGTFVDETGTAIAGSAINYSTGVITGITFTAVVPNGNTIYVSANNYIVGRPFAVLYSNNEFRFWPYPDRAYTFSIMTYKNPDQLVNDTDLPELNLWVDVIAYGAAMKIFADNLDMESYSKVNILFDEHKRLAERRTLKQLSTQRVQTIYDAGMHWPTQFYGYPNG